jgi:hypothetical protein
MMNRQENADVILADALIYLDERETRRGDETTTREMID